MQLSVLPDTGRNEMARACDDCKLQRLLPHNMKPESCRELLPERVWMM